MAWTHRTVSIIHDLANGSNILDAAARTAASLMRIPDEYYAGDSLRLLVSVYDDYTAGRRADFGPTAIAKLYCKLLNAVDTPTELATGTITQASGATEYSELAFSVPSDATLPYDGQSCLLYAVIEDAAATGRTTIVQALRVVSLEGDGSGSASAALFGYEPAEPGDWLGTAPDDVAEALDDLAARLTDVDADRVYTPTGATALGTVYRLSGGAWVPADPDDADCETCELWMALGATGAAGMIAAGVVTNPAWSWATVGAMLWLNDAGALTLTTPTSTTHAGRVARPVGWVRSATSVRFDGHAPGATFEGGS